MKIRASSLFASYIAICLIVLTGLAIAAGRRSTSEMHGRESRQKMVKKLALTDLVLFTDARYTRHPSMADRHSPFQDHPLALEHFPSGSLMPPSPHLRSYVYH